MKRVFSMLLTVIVLLNTVLSASALEESYVVTEYVEGEECFGYAGQELTYGSVQDYFYAYENGDTVCSAYSLLSDREKEYYDAVVNLEPGVLSFKISYTPNLSAEEFSAIDFTAIMNAICLDHPEIFYYNGYSYSRSYYPASGRVVYVVYNITPKKNSETKEYVYNSDNIPGYNEALKSAFESVEVNLTTRYDFVKSLHDFLCNQTSYVNNYASCHDVYGTLVEKQAVCQGYAETFKMFCDYYKIPCVCLTGTANGGAHMWNAVQMDDGLWYLLDITWDDQGSYGIFTDFFLIGLQTKDVYFTGEMFSVSHVSDGAPYLPSLKYATTAYNKNLRFSEFGATYNHKLLENDKKIILSYFDAEENNIYFNGIYLKIDDYFTTANFTAPTGVNGIDEDWKMILLGDCNGDGEADSNDLSVLVNKTLSDSDITTDFDLACDTYCDGVLDVIDIMILERAVSGANTEIVVSD